jgi:hypothetical protein
MVAEDLTTTFKRGLTPVSGLSPTIDIWNVSTGTQLVTDGAMTEIGTTGLYKYNFTTYDPDVGYIFRAKATIDSEVHYNEITNRDDIQLSDVIPAIKAKTDNLPVDPASETNVDANETKIDAVKADTAAIKLKTDNLPVDPASETNVDQNGTAIGNMQIDVTAIRNQTDIMQFSGNNIRARVEDKGILNDPSSLDIADDVWDELLTGATHNTPTSAGRRLRELADQGIIRDDIAQGGTLTTITLDTLASSVDNHYKDMVIAIYDGTGDEQIRKIQSYIGLSKVATISPPWLTTPNGTSKFIIGIGTSVLNDLIADHIITDTFGERVDDVPTVTEIDTELTAQHGSGSWQTGAGSTPSEIAAAVWDAVRSSYNDVGSFGESLQQIVASLSQIVAGVWNAAISSYNSPSTFGAKNQNLTPSENVNDYKANVTALALEATLQLVKLKTDNLPVDPTSEANATSNKNEIISAIPSSGSIADSVWDEPIADHVLTDTFGAKNQRVVPSENVDNYKADVSLLALQSTLLNVKAKTDNLPIDPTSETNATGNRNAIIVEVNNVESKVDTKPTAVQIDSQLSATHGAGNWEGNGGLTKEEIADAVWDELRSGHVISGSFGEAVNNFVGQIIRLLGLSHENIWVENVWSNGLHISSNVEAYDSKANATIHDGVTGLIAQYTLTVNNIAGNPTSHLMVKEP